MKKITLTLLGFFACAMSFGQTFSTGTIIFPAPLSEYSVKIDVTSTEVTLTQIMPSDRWYSLAFNNNSMSSGDVIAFIDTANISDRQLGGFSIPIADVVQSWTTISNDVSLGVRTVVSTRVLNTGEAGDYVFSASAGSINLACSRSASASFALASHGGLANAVSAATYGITLGNAGFEAESFVMFPNPSIDKLTIMMPQEITSKGVLKMYDYLGRVVKKVLITDLTSTIDIGDLEKGNYLVTVRTDYGNSTKNLIVE
ncbi:T9SS type A sorting domain-containing protein [Flavobacterium sp.]|uniref:T9SS type A sorting domain-containing protein n=1 Tax=Flavobacterium sp. TaxID=239 RepID=UPI004048A781